jgi:hypothetical protein
MMKQLIGFITRLFRKNKGRSFSFDEAIAEGFRDTLKELGY